MDATSSEAAETWAKDAHEHDPVWQESLNREIEGLGWSRSVRVEDTHSGVALYVIDVPIEKDQEFSPEGPATFSLSVFLDGYGTLSVDGAAPLSFGPGTAVLFACDRTTKGTNRLQGGHRMRVVDIRLERDLLKMLGGVSLAEIGGEVMTEHSLPDQDVFLIGLAATPALLQAAKDIMTCALPEGRSRSLYLHSKAIEAVSLALTLEPASGAARQIRPLSRGERAKVEQAASLIETSFSENWTIARLAREVGLNDRRLKEGFRIAIGHTVRAHLREARLDAAASLLDTGHSVTETALAVGFENLSHFSKVFREVKGISPSRYRETAGNV